MRRRTAALALWTAAAVLVCLLGGMQRAQSAGARKPVPVPYGLGAGFQPPEFSGRDLTGAPQNLQQYHDQVLVLHFWATWCPYCRSQIPELIELHEQWASKGVRVLTVATDQDAETVRAFVKEQRLPYAVIPDIDSEWPIATQYAVDGVPVTYVIGRDGLIILRLRGKAPLLEILPQVLEPVSTTPST